MNTTEIRRECYGQMVPDFTQLKRGKPLESQAFTAFIESSGTGADGRNLEVKDEAWTNCVQCPDYRTCYDLSLAKMLLNQVLLRTALADRWVGGCIGGEEITKTK